MLILNQYMWQHIKSRSSKYCKLLSTLNIELSTAATTSSDTIYFTLAVHAVQCNPCYGAKDSEVGKCPKSQ